MKKMLFIAALLSAGVAHAQGALRPEIGKPLAKAKSYLAARRYSEAMAQVRVADNARNKSAEESFVIAEMRGAIAQSSGDVAMAARTYQELLASGRVPPAEQVKLLMAEASMSYQLKDYPAVVSWTDKYFKAGGNDPSMRTLLIQAYYLQKDYANAAKLQSAQIVAAFHAGQKPTEQQLQLLAACQENTGDKAGFQNTMTQLVYYYPKPDYWQNLIHNVQTKPGYSDRLSLDMDRFETAIGLIKTSQAVMEMTELALQVPLPSEAKAILDKGYADGILGQGAEAARQQRLRDLVNRTLADQQKTLGKQDADAATDHDGNRLLLLGETYVSMGNFAKGIPMMEEAIRKGGLRHPDDAELHLGVAFLKAGDKTKAMQTFHAVGGREGAADIARLWTLYIGKV
jgi:hypothetical protein